MLLALTTAEKRAERRSPIEVDLYHQDQKGRNMRRPLLRNISIMALVLSVGAALSPTTARGQAIYVANEGNGTVGEYTTSGGVVNPSLVSGLTYNFGVAVSGSNLFVANGGGSGTISQYTTSGAVVNPALVTGLNNPYGVAVYGSNLFVVNFAQPYLSNGTVGEYTTSGAVVNPSLVSGLYAPQGIAVAGSNVFVADPPNGTIGEYTTSGAVVNPSLISGLDYPYGIAVSGSNLFITTDNNTVAEYTTSGTVVNPSLISGLNYPHGIAVSGSNLFVANTNAGTIGEYTTSGAVLNPSLISGLNNPYFIAVSVPSTVALTAVSNATIITGGTGSLSATVSNSAVSGANNLNYTLTAAMQSGSGTLGTVTPATDSLAPGASDSCTVPASSTNLGVNTVSFTASDPNSSNGSLSTSATLTVLDHSNASLSSTATQTCETINFGNVLRGDHPEPELHGLQPGGEHLGGLHGEHATDEFFDKRQYGFSNEPRKLQRAHSGRRQQREHVHGLAEHWQLHDGQRNHQHVRIPTRRRQQLAGGREQQQRRIDDYHARKRRQCYGRCQQFSLFLRSRTDGPRCREWQLRKP